MKIIIEKSEILQKYQKVPDVDIRLEMFEPWVTDWIQKEMEESEEAGGDPPKIYLENQYPLKECTRLFCST